METLSITKAQLAAALFSQRADAAGLLWLPLEGVQLAPSTGEHIYRQPGA